MQFTRILAEVCLHLKLHARRRNIIALIIPKEFAFARINERFNEFESFTRRSLHRNGCGYALGAHCRREKRGKKENDEKGKEKRENLILTLSD